MTKMRPGSTLARQGFTLVEVSVALVVLSIGILAVMGMTTSSIAQVRRGFNVTNSTFAAQQVLDRYAMLPFDSISTGTVVDSISVAGQDYWVVSTVDDVSSTWSPLASNVIYQIVLYSGGGLDQNQNGERFETFVYNTGAW
jgi:type IV pilus assembly protein PilV